MYSHDLETDAQLRSSLWILSGLRLICHCAERQSCHADILTAANGKDLPAAFDRTDRGAKKIENTVQPVIGLGLHSTAFEDVVHEFL